MAYIFCLEQYRYSTLSLITHGALCPKNVWQCAVAIYNCPSNAHAQLYIILQGVRMNPTVPVDNWASTLEHVGHSYTQHALVTTSKIHGYLQQVMWMYPKPFQMCLINTTQGGQCYQGVQAVKRTYIECRCTHSGQAEVEAIVYRGHTDKWEGVYMRR